MSHGRSLIPLRMRDYMPNPRRPLLSDVRARNVFFKGGLGTTHSSLSVNDESSASVGELQRIKQVSVGAVSGGTVTVQVQVDGRDVFQDAARPVSDGRVQEPNDRDKWLFPAGSVVTTIIEATSGAPSGEANVVIETEPYVLVPVTQPFRLHGKDRLRISKRRQADAFNAEGTERDIAVGQRAAGNIGSATRDDSRVEVRGDLAGGADVDPTPPVIKKPRLKARLK